jgi:RNA polymerase sigma-70 factor (ECF subfamily)
VEFTVTRVDTFSGIVVDERVAEFETLPPGEVVVAMYRRDYLHVVRYLRCLGVADGVAQELAQDTFLKLHEHLRVKGDRSNLRGWLYRVARNGALNEQVAARSKRGSVRLDEVEAVGFLTAPESDSPESILLRREYEERIRKTLMTLPANQRECLVLRARQMKYREIAAILGISVSAVGQHIQAGVKKLGEVA